MRIIAAMIYSSSNITNILAYFGEKIPNTVHCLITNLALKMFYKFKKEKKETNIYIEILTIKFTREKK